MYIKNVPYAVRYHRSYSSFLSVSLQKKMKMFSDDLDCMTKR